jgi:hypothetical protein
MKTNSTLVIVIRIAAFILLCLYSLLVFGQADNTSISRQMPLQKFNTLVNEKNIELRATSVPVGAASNIIIKKGYSVKEFGTPAGYRVNMEGNYAAEDKWYDIKSAREILLNQLIIQIKNTAGKLV